MKKAYMFILAICFSIPFAFAQHPHAGKSLDSQVADFIRLIEAHELNLSLSYFSPENFQEQGTSIGQYIWEGMELGKTDAYGKGDNAFRAELEKIKKIRITGKEAVKEVPGHTEVFIEVNFKGGAKKSGTLIWMKKNNVYMMSPAMG